jgi:hypothetical protein
MSRKAQEARRRAELRRHTVDHMALHLSRHATADHLRQLAVIATTAEHRRIVRLAKQWQREGGR